MEILEQGQGIGKPRSSWTIISRNLLEVEDSSGPLKSIPSLLKGWVALISGTYGG